MQILLFAGGLVLLAVATGLYIGGPLRARAARRPDDRDQQEIRLADLGGARRLEVTVLAIGWLLGGNVGIGTLAFALLVGPMVNWTMPLLHALPPRRPGGTEPAALEPAQPAGSAPGRTRPDS